MTRFLRSIGAVGLLCLSAGLLGAGDPTSPDSLVRHTTDGLDKLRPAWTPDGKTLLFGRQESDGAHLWIYRLDPGDPSSLRRLTERDMPEYNAAVAPGGDRVLFVAITQSGTQGNLDIASITLDGKDLKNITGDHGGKLSHQDWPSWAPGGDRFAFSSTHEGNQEIYVASADGSNIERLTQSPGIDAHPCWTPDGFRIIFATDRWGGLEIASMKPDGSDILRLTESPGLDDYPAVSPDCRRIAFVSNRDGNYEIYLMALDGSGPSNLTQSSGQDTFPTWTPDGSGVTFVSNRDGGFDIYTAKPPMDVSP